MIKAFASFALALGLALSAQAQHAEGMREGLSFGASIAPTSKNQLVNPAAVSPNAWQASTTPSSVPSGMGSFSAPLDGSQALGQAKTLGLGGLGTAALDRCANHTPSGDASLDQECAAVNFMAQRCLPQPAGQPQPANCAGSFGAGRAQFDFSTQINDRDPIFNSITAAHRDAEKNSGSTCKPESIVVKPADQSLATCTKSATTDTVTCSQLLQVNCAPPTDGCDAGGIVPGSWAGDMSTSFAAAGNGNYNLQFGTIADNYWRGYGATFDRNLTFEIKDIGLIKTFALTRAAFDDWLMVMVNDKVAYVGPYGGDRLQMTYVSQTCYGGGESDYTYDCPQLMVQYGANAYAYPELATNWNIGLNIDLKPLLKNGTNRLFMRTIVAGAGEGAIVMTTRQYCPRVCTSSWLNQCVELENKSGIKLGNP